MSARPRILVAPTSTDNSIVTMRELGRAGVEVVAADDGYLPAWFRSRHCRRYVRARAAGSRHVRDYLPEIVAATRPAAMLPVNTPATVAAIEFRESRGQMVRTNLPPAESFAAAYDKRRCMEDCRRVGIPCPKVYEPAEASALLRRGAGSDRLVVKPRFDVGGGRGLRIVDDADALQTAIAGCERDVGESLIQEFIPGGTTCLSMLLVLFGPDGRLHAAFTSRKLRQYPEAGGAATVSKSTADAHLVDQMLPLFEHWRWAGPAEVDLKLDERDGTFKVLEVNPRLPSYLRFVVDSGLDVPCMAAGLALDPAAMHPVPFPAYTVGERYVCPGPFVRGVLEEMRRPGSTRARLWAALADIRAARAPCVAEDPLPFIGRMLHW